MKYLPTSKQIDFLNWELGVFFHYEIRTYNEMVDKNKGIGVMKLNSLSKLF